jgi:predicted kinase
MPFLLMLIGIPCAGKSSWVRDQKFDSSRTVILDIDSIIATKAAETGKTYGEIFDDEAKNATSEMYHNLHDAIASGKDIVWDMTNLTSKSRHAKLFMIPSLYYKIAVVFATPSNQELNLRLRNRPEKMIPWSVIESMKQSFQVPLIEEGFDEIITVGFDEEF